MAGKRDFELLREEVETLRESPLSFTFDGLLLGSSMSRLNALLDELAASLNKKKRINVKLIEKIEEIKKYTRLAGEQHEILLEVIGLLKEEIRKLKEAPPVKEETPLVHKEPMHLINNAPPPEKTLAKKGIIERIIEWIESIIGNKNKKFKKFK